MICRFWYLLYVSANLCFNLRRKQLLVLQWKIVIQPTGHLSMPCSEYLQCLRLRSFFTLLLWILVWTRPCPPHVQYLSTVLVLEHKKTVDLPLTLRRGCLTLGISLPSLTFPYPTVVFLSSWVQSHFKSYNKPSKVHELYVLLYVSDIFIVLCRWHDASDQRRALS